MDDEHHQSIDEAVECERLKREMGGDKAPLATIHTVGSGISESKRISLPLLAAPELLAQRAPPWAENRAMIARLCEPIVLGSRACPGREHRACCHAEPGKSCFPKWREREDPQWYALRIYTLLGSLNDRITDQGELVAPLAADEAFELGSIFTEARIKFCWDEHAKRGEVVIRGAKDGGDRRRSASMKRKSREETIAAVDALIAKGKPKMAAYSIVAEQQGVTQQTIAKEYQSAKK